MFQKEQVDPLQMKLQQVNGLGQGLIQSAGKNCDVQGLEHDMEEINARWNTLNKKVSSNCTRVSKHLRQLNLKLSWNPNANKNLAVEVHNYKKYQELLENCSFSCV